MRNAITNACVTDPNSCGSTQHVDPVTDVCTLNPVDCSHIPHTHANATNDACLPDPPFGCPQGQHDDGTYQCVANEIFACKAGTQAGSIAGIPQCVPQTTPGTVNDNYAQAKAAADAAKAAADAATNKWLDDMNKQAIANGRLEDDPDNSQLQQEAATAASNAAASQSEAVAATEAARAAAETAEALKGLSKESTTQSIDESLKTIKDNTTKGESASNGDSCGTPPSCTGDPVQCAVLRTTFLASCQGDDATQDMADEALGGTTEEEGEEITLSNLNGSGLGLSGSCPAPRIYSIYRGSSMTVDLSAFCDLAEIIGYFLVMTSSFIAIRIVSS